MNETARIEEKIGKIYTRQTEIKGNVKQLWDTVFGNGLPGHEKRIVALENEMRNRRETCPFVSDKQNRYVVIGLYINAAIMITGFIALYLGA